MNHIKQIKTLAAITVAAFALTACGSSAQENTTLPAQDNTINFDGDWKQISTETSQNMTGIVQDDMIMINIDKDGEHLRYWFGTFEPKNTDKIVSTQLTAWDQLSGSSTKEFTYNNGILSYDFTMMGVTKTIQLKKTA